MSYVEALVNRLDVFLFLIVVLYHSYRTSFPPVMPVHKYVRGRKRRLQQPCERAQRTKRDGGRSAVHHLGAEKSGATKARPEARLWLRDYLGRQAGGFGGAAGERGGGS